MAEKDREQGTFMHNRALGSFIDIDSLQNRLLKVCYVPATSAGLSRLLFLLFCGGHCQY